MKRVEASVTTLLDKDANYLGIDVRKPKRAERKVEGFRWIY